MKRITEPGTILLWNNELVRVVGIGQGKTIAMVPVGKEQRCPTCGHFPMIHSLEDSRNFQENAKPVDTIQDSEEAGGIQ